MFRQLRNLLAQQLLQHPQVRAQTGHPLREVVLHLWPFIWLLYGYKWDYMAIYLWLYGYMLIILAIVISVGLYGYYMVIIWLLYGFLYGSYMVISVGL